MLVCTFKQEEALTIHVITYKDIQHILLRIAPHPTQHTLTICSCYHIHGALIFIELLMHPSANTYRSSHHLDYHIHAFVHIHTHGVDSLLDQEPMQVYRTLSMTQCTGHITIDSMIYFENDYTCTKYKKNLHYPKPPQTPASIICPL